jgi:hypothetical protein
MIAENVPTESSRHRRLSEYQTVISENKAKQNKTKHPIHTTVKTLNIQNKEIILEVARK